MAQQASDKERGPEQRCYHSQKASNASEVLARRLDHKVSAKSQQYPTEKHQNVRKESHVRLLSPNDGASPPFGLYSYAKRRPRS